MDLMKAIEERRSVRKFKMKSCGEREIILLLESALRAPCAGGLVSIRLIVVDDKGLKEKLYEASLRQKFINEVSHVIVVCSDGKLTKKAYGKYAPNFLRQQAGAAVENLLLTATNLGLASCWVGSFDEEAVKRALMIPADIDVEAILPIGYAADKLKPSFRQDLKSIARDNTYVKKFTKPKTIDS